MTTAAKKSPKPLPPEPKEVKEPEAETPMTRQDRVTACADEIKAVLEKHRCRIVPYFMDPEPVGSEGSRVMLTAAYGLVAEG